MFNKALMYTISLQLLGCKQESLVLSPLEDDNTIHTSNNDTNKSPGSETITVLCDANVIYFSQDFLPILISNCTTSSYRTGRCHSGNTPGGGILLTDNATVAATAVNGKLLCSVTYESYYMPMPKNASKLYNCEPSIILKWMSESIQNS